MPWSDFYLCWPWFLLNKDWVLSDQHCLRMCARCAWVSMEVPVICNIAHEYKHSAIHTKQSIYYIYLTILSSLLRKLMRNLNCQKQSRSCALSPSKASSASLTNLAWLRWGPELNLPSFLQPAIWRQCDIRRVIIVVICWSWRSWKHTLQASFSDISLRVLSIVSS